NLRVKDLAGNWSKAVNTSVVIRPNLIFKNGFETGEPPWSSTVGAVSYNSAAAMGGTRGMQVTMPGGAANAASYLTDSTPSAETGYHVRFAVNPNTLASGAAIALTLFDARTATNGQVFTLDYRLNAGDRQVRTVLSRSTGAVTGAWVTLPPGMHTLQLDWVSATGGSLTLSVDGTVQYTSTGNTSALRVDTARLGVIAGYSTSTTNKTVGAVYFDAFSSGRTSAP
ncbi:MAG: Multicopper oxidase, partial [Pseudonocardiales bacterium]|nr:Multicopper oxidase [Pseudonocardiales bacterium]